MSKPSGHTYISSKIPSARLPILTNRYAPTTQANFNTTSIGSRNGAFSFREKVSLNNEIITNRKRNHLNSQAHKRDQSFRKIYLQNNRLYKRINSQKSLYSQQSLNKSTVSIKSISRCSSRDSTRKNTSLSRNDKAAPRNKKGQNIQIKQQNVEKIQDHQVIQFKNIFADLNQTKSTKPTKVSKTSNSFYIRRDKNEDGKTSNKPIIMGDLLHRIAQQLCQPTQVPKTQRKKKRV